MERGAPERRFRKGEANSYRYLRGKSFIEPGREEDRQEEAIELVLRRLTRRFGRLTESQKRRIKELDLPKIEALGESLLDFKSRTDLAAWLKQNAS